MIHKGEKTQYIEKWFMREAFNSKDEFGTQLTGFTGTKVQILTQLRNIGAEYLPQEVLFRQKEQFSDGVGYDWIDGLKAHAAAVIDDTMFAFREHRFPYNTPATKEVCVCWGGG